MPSAFTRTLRSLENDSIRPRVVLAVLVAPLLAGWVTWMRGSRVSVYAVTAEARTEVADVAVPVETTEPGRVLVSNLVLGRRVTAGEVLLELDASMEQAKLAELQTRVETLRSRLSPLRKELEALATVRSSMARVGQARLGVAATKVAASQREAERSRQVAGISEQLRAQGVGSRLDEIHAAHAAAAQDDRLSQTVAELRELALSKDLEERTAALRELELTRQIADADADLQLAQAAVRTLELSISRRTIRALSGGFLGDVAPLTVGVHVAPGRPLATIIPEGKLKLVAYFTPQETVGRVVPGQPASVQFHGFPWTQFGIARAEVTSVGAEPRENAVRVELMLDQTTTHRIPLQHGMPASVEVVIDETSPWGMLLRAVGGATTPSSPAPPPAPSVVPGRAEPGR